MLLESEMEGRREDDGSTLWANLKSVCDFAAGGISVVLGRAGSVALPPPLEVLLLCRLSGSARTSRWVDVIGGRLRPSAWLWLGGLVLAELDLGRLLDWDISAKGNREAGWDGSGCGDVMPGSLRLGGCCCGWGRARSLCLRRYASVIFWLSSSFCAKSILSKSKPSKRPSS